MNTPHLESDHTTPPEQRGEQPPNEENQKPALSGIVHIDTLLPLAERRLDTLYDTEHPTTGTLSGFHELNRITGGFQPGDLAVIAGRPAMGKSTLAMNIASHVARHRQTGVVLFSLEMSADNFVSRLICSLGSLEPSRFGTGQFSHREYARLKSTFPRFYGTPLYIDNHPALTPEILRERCLQQMQQTEIGSVIVDYLQLLQCADTQNNRTNEVNEICRSLKAIARELNLPLVVLSQLDRSSEHNQVQNSSIAANPDSAGLVTPIGTSRLRSPHLSSTINPDLTFENYVITQANQQTRSAVLRMAESLGTLYNPLTIYGPAGSGKSHLFHALCNQIRQTQPDARIVYMTAEKFTANLVQSLQSGRMEPFKSQFYDLDIFLLDDIDCLPRKVMAQQAIFTILNTMLEKRQQLIFATSDLQGTQHTLEKRLAFGLGQGLYLPIATPGEADRLAILHTKSSQIGTAIPEEVLVFLAAQVQTSVSDLESALRHLVAFSQLAQSPITLEFAENALCDMLAYTAS